MNPETYDHLIKSDVNIPEGLFENSRSVAWHAGAGAGDYEIECVVKSVLLWMRDNSK